MESKSGWGGGGAAGGRAATPFAAERERFTWLKNPETAFQSYSVESGHNALPLMIAPRQAGLLSGPVGKLEGKNALGHAAGPTRRGFGASDLAFGSH
jgi:hypothetical protein